MNQLHISCSIYNFSILRAHSSSIIVCLSSVSNVQIITSYLHNHIFFSSEIVEKLIQRHRCILCFMFYVLCFMFYGLCFIHRYTYRDMLNRWIQYVLVERQINRQIDRQIDRQMYLDRQIDGFKVSIAPKAFIFYLLFTKFKFLPWIPPMGVQTSGAKKLKVVGGGESTSRGKKVTQGGEGSTSCFGGRQPYRVYICSLSYDSQIHCLS